MLKKSSDSIYHPIDELDYLFRLTIESKLTLVGTNRVGKKSIFIRYKSDEFDDTYPKEIKETKRRDSKNIKRTFKGNEYEICFNFSTGIPEEHEEHPACAGQHVGIMMLVVSSDSLESFNSLDHFIDKKRRDLYSVILV